MLAKGYFICRLGSNGGLITINKGDYPQIQQYCQELDIFFANVLVLVPHKHHYFVPMACVYTDSM